MKAMHFKGFFLLFFGMYVCICLFKVTDLAQSF